MMALAVLLVLEWGLYISCFVCGIVTAASVTIVQGNFGGHCMLYGAVSYNATSKLIGVQSSTSSSLCYFVSAISIMVAVVCFSLSVYWVYTFCSEGELKRENVWMNVLIAVSGVFLFFLLVTGCMLKIGRDTLCSSVTKNVPNTTSCEKAQSEKWASPLDGERFYSSLHKAETAVWINFFFWLIIGVLVIIQRRRGSASKLIGAAPTGSLFGETGVTPEETEPFFNRPGRPQ
ncbi:transmembrane protein 179B [Simochromis diagramma]|uniref:transmembrane protein 179B n=1 Tax=Simochromis diagramma TaxID=43689 RepID=UPI001A7ED2EA|nr:transmembrane protein 179B [Simochromis diagramma]